MTKKHFKELAYQISQIDDINSRLAAARAVAAACRTFNPTFDAGKFYIACAVVA